MKLNNLPRDILAKVWFYDVFLLCVSGFSIDEVSEITNIDKEDVTNACRRFLKFDGWVISLDYNPWFFYKDLTEREMYGIIDDEDLEKITMELCERFDKIRKELDKYYD
ncbi:hypothetical protein LCGC14_1208580 [marine sediment metagenome]|uniref:Uncharacterized protein n=1 Tax=marine sediment metagenome TaxID=412755 RepID=A0A0F9M257_9ZZZZ